MTLSEEMRGSFEICSMCGWEDDNLQLSNPDYEGGANRESLREAQQNFIQEQLKDTASQESGDFEKDPNWKPLES